MHVLYLCDEYPPPVIGGIGQVVRLLAEGLVAREHRATVVGQYWVDERQEYEQNGVTVMKLPRPRANRLTRNDLVRRWLLARDVHRFVRERAIDIVESPSYMGDGAFVRGRRHGAAFHVLRAHGSNAVDAARLGMCPSRFARLLEGKALNRADHVVLVGRQAGLDYLSFFRAEGRPYSVIANPVDTALFRPLCVHADPERPVLLYIGRVDPIKGAFELAKVLPRVFESFPELVVNLAGAESHVDTATGRTGRDIVLASAGERWRDNIRFLGRLSHEELVRTTNDATIAILPSLIENFPCAVIEAMACGKPVIASRRAHGDEVLIHGESGILVDPLNPQELAAAIVDLLRDTARCERLGSNARNLVERRNCLDVMLDANIRYYESCLAEKPLTGELLPLADFAQTSRC